MPAPRPNAAARPPRVPLRVHRVAMAGGELRLRGPRSGLDLLRRDRRRLAAAERGELPHWAELWPASVALARRLARGAPLDGRAVWDLGCGLGLAGLAAARRGARVVLADHAAEALDCAAANAAALGLTTAVTRRFDWRTATVPASDCDLLLLADVAWRWRHAGDLLRSIDAVLDGGGGVLCADPHRPAANDLFAALRGLRGAHLECCDVQLDGERSSIRIAVLGRVPAGRVARPAAQRTHGERR